METGLSTQMRQMWHHTLALLTLQGSNFANFGLLLFKIIFTGIQMYFGIQDNSEFTGVIWYVHYISQLPGKININKRQVQFCNKILKTKWNFKKRPTSSPVSIQTRCFCQMNLCYIFLAWASDNVFLEWGAQQSSVGQMKVSLGSRHRADLCPIMFESMQLSDPSPSQVHVTSGGLLSSPVQLT